MVTESSTHCVHYAIGGLNTNPNDSDSIREINHPYRQFKKQKDVPVLMCTSVSGKEIRGSSIAMCVACQSAKNSPVSL